MEDMQNNTGAEREKLVIGEECAAAFGHIRKWGKMLLIMATIGLCIIVAGGIAAIMRHEGKENIMVLVVAWAYALPIYQAWVAYKRLGEAMTSGESKALEETIAAFGVSLKWIVIIGIVMAGVTILGLVAVFTK